MKIRRKTPCVHPMRSHAGWIMATTAMLHFCSYAPTLAWEKKSNGSKDTDRTRLRAGDTSGKSAKKGDRLEAQKVLQVKRSSMRKNLLARLDADPRRAIEFDIPPQPLGKALEKFGEQAGVQLAYTTAEIEGLHAAPVSGTYTPEKALHLLLIGTGINFNVTGDRTFTLKKSGPPSTLPNLKEAEQIAGAQQEPAPPASTLAGREEIRKPVKVPEIIVKDVVEREELEGYKADASTVSTRSKLPLNETPTSIGVVTREVIQDTLSLSQNEAFEHVSGMSRGNLAYGRGEAFNIRGFAIPAGSFTGLRSNGLPTNSQFALDPALIDRYEIIKGPASIVGGASSPGGLVNRITKRPLFDNFASAQFQAGSYSFYRGVADANGVLPQNENLSGRLIFVVEEGGNFVDNVDVRQYTVGPSLGIDLFDGAGSLLLTGHYQRFEGSTYIGFPLLEGGKVPDIPRARNFGGGTDNGADMTYKGQNYELHYTHEFINNLNLSVKGGYSKSDQTDKVIYGYNYGSPIPSSGNSSIYAGLRDFELETFAGEIFVSKEFEAIGQKHEVLLGSDHRNQLNDFLLGYAYLGTDNIFNPANNFQAPADDVLRATPVQDFEVDTIQTGIFGQLVTRPLPRLTLVGAFRHDWADVTNKNLLNNVDIEKTFKEWTGRVGATYEVFPGIRVYAGYAQSFQVNSFSVTVNSELLPPEKGENYEVGAKMSLLDGRVRMTTALFRSYRQNVSTVDPNNPNFFIAVGEQRHQGIEFDIAGQVWPGLDLIGSFTWLDAEITEDNNAANIGSTPTQIPRSYVGRIFATYELQSGPLQGLGVGGGVYFQSGFELELPNRFRTDSYERVDAVLFYHPPQKAYELAINVRNLFDATYIENPGTLIAFNQFGAPLSVFGTLRVNFSPGMDYSLW